MSEIDAAVMANEKSCPDFVFQIPDTSADGRFLNVQRLRRTSKASTLGSRNNVAKMAQLDCQGTFFLCWSAGVAELADATVPLQARSDHRPEPWAGEAHPGFCGGTRPCPTRLGFGFIPVMSRAPRSKVT